MILLWISNIHRFIKLQVQIMTNNIDIINAAVTLIIKAAILAARFSGRAHKRSLKRLAKMDANTKDKEIILPVCAGNLKSGTTAGGHT